MSKIDNMIAELCPNGVEYKRLGLFCTKASTVKWSLVKSNTLSYVDPSSVDIQTGRIGDLSEITRESAPPRELNS